MKKQTKLGLALAAAAVLSVSVASLVSARGWVQQGADWYYVDNNGDYVTDTIQSSGNAKFYLGEDGAMQKDYFLEDYDSNTYYFGSNGAMVTNTWVAIESSRVDNQDDYVPDNYWYYFQASGKAMKGSSTSGKKTTIDGKKYMFNEYGQMSTGWIKDDGKTINPDDEDNPFALDGVTYYGGGDNDGVLRAGWVVYYDGYDDDGGKEWLSDKSILYFYFNTTNNKMIVNSTKKINGRTYAFSDEGIMLSGWDVVNGAQTDEGYTPASLANKTVYFSAEDDGHQVKKGWVYTVPAASVDTKAYGDSEEKYMYFNASGDAVRDQFKKINGKFYVFNPSGIMKTGLVIWASDGVQHDPAEGATEGGTYKYVDKVDFDWADGSDVSKKGFLRYDEDDTDYIVVNSNGVIVNEGGKDDGDYLNKTIRLHLFGDDGARKTGTNNVEFADDTYTFVSTSSGNKPSGASSKKYYSLGILLKASTDIRYGIYNMATIANATDVGTNKYGGVLGGVFGPQKENSGDALWDTAYAQNLVDGKYLVLTTAGAKQKGAKSAKKDADGNYWFIDQQDSYLKGIWDVNIKRGSTSFNTNSFAVTDAISAAFTSGTAYSASAISAVYDQEYSTPLFYDDALDNGGNVYGSGAPVWTYKTNNANTEAFFAHGNNYDTYMFQSDYGDKSNAWIPFGVRDAGGKTCTMAADFDFDTDGTDGKTTNAIAHGHEVTPNSDYFLNCFWTVS